MDRGGGSVYDHTEFHLFLSRDQKRRRKKKRKKEKKEEEEAKDRKRVANFFFFEIKYFEYMCIYKKRISNNT
jgi:hypothetical protein